MGVQHSHRHTMDIVAENKGIRSEGNIPARVIAQRQLTQQQKASGIKRKRDNVQEAIRQYELAKERGFPNGNKYNSFIAGINSLAQYKGRIMYKMSFFNDYPEDTTIGQFLRSKPNGRIHSFKGKNMNRIVHAAIEATIPEPEVTERIWVSMGERTRYRNVLKKFRQLLEREIPEAREMHRNIPIESIMSRFDNRKKPPQR